jgi:predicted nucleotidyltransferase
LYGRVIADVQAVTNALEVMTIVTGAFARDLQLLLYTYGIDTVRQTEDVDFGLAVVSWDSFAEVKASLVRSGTSAIVGQLKLSIKRSAAQTLQALCMQS